MTRPWWMRVDGIPPRFLERERARQRRGRSPLPARRLLWWRVVLLVVYPLMIVSTALQYPLFAILPVIALMLMTVWGLPRLHRHQIVGLPAPSSASAGPGDADQA